MIKKIGILGAMPEEIDEILVGIEDIEQEEVAGVTYYKGKRDEKHVIVCYGGMGKVNAASTTQVLISHFKVNAIIFSGIAGNMTDKIGIGDVVVGETLCYHDADERTLVQSSPGTSLYTSDTHLVKAACYGSETIGVKFIVGKIATGDRFIGDPMVKEQIKIAFNPDCVEMEGAAVGQVCMRNNIPFVVLRAMSDNSDQTIEELMEKEFNITEYVQTASAIVLAMLQAI